MQKCIICETKNKFKTVYSLGEQYQSGFIDSPEDESKFVKRELALVECKACGFTQIKETFEPDEMYREYWYRSSTNLSMVTALQDIYEKSVQALGRTPERVIDVGCNCGTLLSFYDPKYTYRVGFDPANNLKEEAEKHTNVFINDYFYYDEPLFGKNNFDIVTAIAMFYDLPNPRKFLDDVKSYLKQDGVFVVQMTDLYSMLSANAFDNLTWEHIAYYSLLNLHQLFETCGLRIFDIEYNDVNGKSVRLYIDKQVRNVSQKVTSQLDIENEFFKNFDWKDFASLIDIYKNRTVKFIKDLNEYGKEVYALGASTKGNTLLQYYGLTNKDIKACLEVSDFKIGKYTLGTNIPIVSQYEFAHKKGEDKPYMLVLPWHFAQNLIPKHVKYSHLIFPLPKPKLVVGNAVEIITIDI